MPGFNEYGYGFDETDYGLSGYGFSSILTRLTPNLFKAAHSTAGKVGPAPVPVGRIRRTTDSATLDLYGSGSDGAVDPNVVKVFNGWNLLRNSVFENASGGAPTNWLQPVGAGTSAAASSTLYSGENAWSQTATAQRPFIEQTSKTVLANTVYTLSVIIENITGGLAAEQVLRATSTPAGATVTYVSCEANPTGVAAGVVGTGELLYQLAISSTAGSINFRVGIGVSTNATGTIRFSRPQMNVGTTRDTYEPRTSAQGAAGDSVWTHRYEQAEPIGRNLLTYSADLRNTSEAGSTRLWANSIGGTGVNATGSQVAGVSPLGYDATRLQFNLGGGTTTTDLTRRVQSVTTTVGVQYVISFKIKSYDGSSTYRMHVVSPTGATVNFDCTPEWTTVESTAVAGSSSINFGMGLRGGQTPANSNTADVLVSEVQVEVASTRSSYDHRTTRTSATRLDLIQPSSTLQPFVCQQGVPCVTSNGRLTSRHIAADARRMYVNNSTAEFNELHTTGGTAVVVSKSGDTATTKVLIGNQPLSNLAGFRVYQGTTENFGAQAGRLDIAGVASTGHTVDVAYLLSSTTSDVMSVNVLDPDNATASVRGKLWTNGVANATANVEAGTPFSENCTVNLTVGSTPSGSGAWDGDISETYLAGSLISTADQVVLQAARGSFFGLSISQNIVISTQPNPNPVYDTGETLTLTIVATNVQTYSWQRSTDGGTNWSGVGTNSATLSLLAGTAVTDGDVIRCVLSNPLHSTTSNSCNVVVLNLSADADLALWLDANYGLFQERTGASATTAASSSGDPVGTWRDKRGSINGFPASDARRPVYRPTGLNGLPAVEFDGTDDVLDYTTALAAAFKDKPHIYAVLGWCSIATAAADTIINISVNANTANRFGVITGRGSTSGRLSLGARRLDADAAVALDANGAVTTDVGMVTTIAANYATSDAIIQKNGQNVASSTSFLTDGNTENLNSNIVAIGASSAGGSAGLDGMISGLMLFTPATAFTEAELLARERYIGRLCGVTI